jgi:hypothetical protein
MLGKNIEVLHGAGNVLKFVLDRLRAPQEISAITWFY